MTSDYFNSIKESIPHQPGIYKYFDKDGKWLYVGKAKNLRKRVQQYFVENRMQNARLKLMVKQIEKIEFTTVDSEHDALILENGLIKNHQPKYNIRQKDDKTFPWIVIKNERFPRVFFTRKFIKDGSTYLGPYTSVLFTKEMFKMIKNIFPLRTCNLNLSPEKIAKGQYKVCLEYHLGNCKAPCVGYQKEEEYLSDIKSIKDVLKGKFSEIRSIMSENMKISADKMEFEQADRWKKKIEQLKVFESKSVIFNPSWDSLAAVNIYEFQKKYIVNYLIIENGTIVETKSMILESELGQSTREVLEHFIVDFSLSRPDIEELLVPEQLEIELQNAKLTIPLIGEKKGLLALSMKNARTYAIAMLSDTKFEKKKANYSLLQEAKEVLRLTDLPSHIECFDNSNIQGTHPVAACVVFKNGKPSKKDYRHFHIKTVEGPNDFGSMKEVVYRRYKRFVEEKIELPQLIVIDGGKGQLSHAIEALEELGIADKLTIVGVAKRLEEIYYKNDPIPLYIDKRSPVLKLIQNLRDEAHRFGLKFHRNLRSKSMIKTQLSDIKGLGKSSIDKLLKKYKSVENIKKANFEELEELIGKNRAEVVSDFFKIK